MQRGSFAVGKSAFLYRCGTHECDLLSSSIPPSLSSDASLLSPRKPVLLPFQTYKMSLLDVSTNVALSLVVTGPLNFSMLLDMVMKLKYISGGLKDTETLSTGNLEYDVVELDQKRYLLQVKALSEGGTSALHVKVSEEDDRKEKEKPIARRLSMAFNRYNSMSRLIDPPKTPATSFLSKIEEPRRTNSRLRSSRRESVTNIKPINLINLPEYALRTAEGLVSALALAATQNEKTTPFNAQYTKQISVSFYSLSSVPTPGNRLLGSGGDEHRDQFIFDATGLCEIDLASPAQRNGADKLLKEKAIMEFNRFGYHASENRLRDFWVDKFESVGSRFSSGSQLSKALKIIRKQTSASEDIAFCGLCYCDGDALEVISRFKNCNGALDQDLASVPKLFPVPILLERVMQSFEQPPVPSERSMPGSISKKGSQIELFPSELQLPSLASCGAENTSVPPTKSILDVIRSPKYERPERLVDKVLESTVSMNATSRKCLLRSGERVLWASIQKEQRKLKTPGPFTKRSVE